MFDAFGYLRLRCRSIDTHQRLGDKDLPCWVECQVTLSHEIGFNHLIKKSQDLLSHAHQSESSLFNAIKLGKKEVAYLTDPGTLGLDTAKPG